MKLLLLLVLSFQSVFACDELLKQYPKDCQIQDKYNALQDRLGPLERISVYRALRFISRRDYVSAIGKGREVKRIYNPYKTWEIWDQSADYILSELRADELSLSDLQRINAVSMVDSLDEMEEAIEDDWLQEFREGTNNFKIHPRDFDFWFNISRNGDLPIKLRVSDEINGRHDVLYPNGDDLEDELQKWINEYKDSLEAIKDGRLAPIEFMAVTQRYLVAIHPFDDGNGRLSGFIQDLLSQKYGLPFFPRGDLQNELALTREAYISLSYQKINEMLDYLVHCYQNPFQYRYSCQKI